MTSYGETALVRGLTFLAEKQASIANNLANVDTTGFKRRTAVAQQIGGFQSVLDRQLSSVGYTERADMQRGGLRETGNRFDVAVDGPAWLRVQDASGKAFYTRNGQLAVSTDGRLTTREGLAVLDQAGRPIVFGAADELSANVTISPNGTIADPDSGRRWGPLALVEIPKPEQLVPIGKSLWVDPANQKTTQLGDGLQQGYLEGSNVDSVQELVQMITVERSFAATQKVLSGIGRLQENMITDILK